MSKYKNKRSKQKNKKMENGSITLFVLIAMLFFLIVIFSQYTKVKNKEVAQEKELIQLKESYEKTPEEIKTIYEHTVETNLNFEITLSQNSYIYDGTEKEPTVVVTYNNKVLVMGIDYIVKYSNNIDAGIATVTVVGKGNFNLTNTVTFKIERAELSTAVANNKTYNGTEQEGVSGSYVDWSGTTKATNAGNYTAIATPDKNHAWSDGTTIAKNISWTIDKKEVQKTSGNYSGNYDGKEHSIILTIKEPTSEYTIYYSTSTALTSSNYTLSGSTTKPTITTAGSQTVYWYVHTTNTNYSDISGSNTMTMEDTTAPVISAATASTAWSNVNKIITITASDAGGSGIAGYAITTSNTAPTSWISNTATTWTSTTTYGNGTYYAWVKDGSGNVSNSKAVTVSNIETTVPTITVNSNTTAAKSQTGTITIGDSDSGLAAGTYTVKYTWTTSTTAPTWSGISTTTTITVSAGAKTGTATVSKSDGTGTYYLHVQGQTLKDQAGNTSSPSAYGTFKLDNTAPTVTFGTNGNTTYAKSQSTTVTVTDGGGSTVNTSSLKYQWTQSTTAPAESTFSSTFTSGGTITKSDGTGNNWYLWILAKDSLGNTTITKSNAFYLDNTIPTISVSNDSTVAKTQTGTITIGDSNSGLAAGTYTVKYTWTTSTTAPTWSGISTTTTITVSAGAKTGTATVSKSDGTGTYYLHVQGQTLKDQAGNTSSPSAYGTFKLDNTAPTVTFGTNGNTTYAKSQSTTVTVTDGGGSTVNTSSLKYQWTQSTTAPAESTFSSTFTSGGTITKSDGTGNNWYLWILAKDNLGNTTITKSNAFYLDNTAPTTTVPTATSTTNSITVTFSQTDSNSGINGSTRQYAIKKTSDSTWGSWVTDSNTTHTFTGLTLNTSYDVKTQVKDTVGNGYTESTVKAITTVNITKPTITLSTTDWTNQNITATITYPNISGLTKQYSYDNSTWSTYSSALTIDSNKTIYARSIDSTNQGSDSTRVASLAVTNIDKTAPNTPTIANPTNGNWTKTDFALTLSSSDTQSGIAYYQYSYDKQTWNTYANSNKNQFVTTNFSAQRNQLVYIRCFDYANNVSNISSTYIRIDKTGPTTPSVTYNSGANSCSWKNNYNMNLSSTDAGCGVDHYEVDWTGDGNSNGTVSANFIPWNGYSSCNNRFRAVDKLGNVSDWSSVHHIHMDTEAPSKTSINLNGYTSGTWTASNVTISASATDNIGVAYYQCSHDISNESNAYNIPNPWTISWDGWWTFYIRAVDHAGNVGAWSDAFVINRTVYQINNSSYITYACTLADAIYLAENSATVYLLKDFTDTSVVYVSKYVIFSTNSHTLYRNDALFVQNGGNLRIDGSGCINTNGVSTLRVGTGGNATFGAVTVLNNASLADVRGYLGIEPNCTLRITGTIGHVLVVAENGRVWTEGGLLQGDQTSNQLIYTNSNGNGSTKWCLDTNTVHKEAIHISGTTAIRAYGSGGCIGISNSSNWLAQEGVLNSNPAGMVHIKGQSTLYAAQGTVLVSLFSTNKITVNAGTIYSPGAKYGNANVTFGTKVVKVKGSP